MKEIQEIKFDEINIGDKFISGGNVWVVTDKGSRVIVAVDTSKYSDYDIKILAAVEHVFNEDDYNSGDE